LVTAKFDTSTTAGDGGDTIGEPPGGVPVAVAVLLIAPAATSAAVTTYVAVHVSDANDANDADGHEIALNVPDPLNDVSFTVTVFNVVAPVLVTKKLYVTVCPAADTTAGDADFATVIPGTGFVVHNGEPAVHDDGGGVPVGSK
jgi:hypothetical protein